MNIDYKYYGHINYIYCFKDLWYCFFLRAFDWFDDYWNIPYVRRALKQGDL